MKTLAANFLLLCLLAISSSAFAEDMDNAKWDAYCKKQKDRCEKAEMLCELNPKGSCAEIKNAFITDTPIPQAVRERSGRD